MRKDLKRIQRIVNQAEIARRLHVSEAYISQIFSGKRKAVKQIARIKGLLLEEISKIEMVKGEPINDTPGEARKKVEQMKT